MTETIDQLVQAAIAGDRRALESVVGAIQTDVYHLARRMLWHPQDAEDAAQEILVKVITHLGTFRGESAFSTWVYRIACNHLLNVKQSRAERRRVGFDEFAVALAAGLAGTAATAPQAEDALLLEEIAIGCTSAMLLCLDRDHRVAYVLAEILDLSGEEAGAILGIQPTAFRKRLSRARRRLRSFMERQCGLVNAEAPCSCARQLAPALREHRIDPQALLFAGRPVSSAPRRTLSRHARQLEELDRALQVLRSQPDFAAPATLLASVRALLDSGRIELLSSRGDKVQ